MKKFEPDSIALFLFNISDKLKAISQKSNMSFVSMDLSKAELVFGFIDYDKRSWNGEIRLISHNDEGNKQTVNSLNMIKGMGALAGPEVAELLNNINITSSSEDIRLTFKISDELLEKVKKKTEEKMLFQNR